MPRRLRERSEQGNALVVVMVVTMILSTLAIALVTQGIGEGMAGISNRIEIKLLADSESALHANYLRLELDPLFPVKDSAEFGFDAAEKTYVGKPFLLATDSEAPAEICLSFTYFLGASRIAFASRTRPSEKTDKIKVTVSAKRGPAERKAVAWYEYRTSTALAGAIVSGAKPSGLTGLPAKVQATEGDVVLCSDGRSGQHFLYGDVKTNGEFRYYTDALTQSAVLNTNNVSGVLGTEFPGQVQSKLASTAGALNVGAGAAPDKQLFEYSRYRAVARAGGGQLFSSLGDFVKAMNAANRVGQALEGIIVVDVDPSLEGPLPRLRTVPPTQPGDHLLPGGINIHGTMMIQVKAGTSPHYKISFETPVHINPADLTGLDVSDPSTFQSGYPAAISNPALRPYGVDISATHPNFTASDDLPALMIDGAMLDLHGPLNISGIVYSPNSIEIDNKAGQLQYINGGIIAGGGLMLQGNATSGNTVIRFDVNAMERLQTSGKMGKTLTRTGFGVMK